MRNRSFLVIALVLGLALLLSLAACGGKEEPAPAGDTGSSPTEPVALNTDVPPTATTAPTAVPTAIPTAEPTAEPAATESFDSSSVVKPVNLDSFQSDISMTWQGVISDGSEIEGTLTMSMQYVREPLAQRIIMSGDFPGADYLQDQSSAGGDALEIYVVEGQTYMNMFGTWMQMPTEENQFDVEEMAFGASDELVNDLEEADYKGVETINGVEAKHYTFDERALKDGDFGEGSKIEKAEGDIYLAVEGNYLVHMDVTMTGSNFEIPTGGSEGAVEEGTWEMTIDLSSINEPIEIVVPEEALQNSGAPEDIPLPEDATEVASLGGLITFSSATAPGELATWYKDQMPANGWTLKSDSTMGELFMLEYTKDGRTASFMITTDSDSGATSVLVTLSEE